FVAVVARVIRDLRAGIIVARFTGTPRHGHGHHQVAGLITQEAFRAAADPNRFPEYGNPWQAKKLYLNGTDNDPNNPNNPNNANNPNSTQTNQNNQPGIRINVGEFDSILGRSYNQIAIEGRSMHRSQGQGGAQEQGPRQTRLQLIQKAVNVSDDAPILAGVLSRLPDVAQLDSTLSAELAGLAEH